MTGRDWLGMKPRDFDQEASAGVQLALAPAPDPYGTLDLLDAIAAQPPAGEQLALPDMSDTHGPGQIVDATCNDQTLEGDR